MRKAIYQHLIKNCTIITDWYQTGMSTVGNLYGVIKFEDEMESPFNRRGFFRYVSIWPYSKGEDFAEIDEAINEIANLLDGKVLETDDGFKFELELLPIGRDFRDPDLKAITRKMEFRIPQIRRK